MSAFDIFENELAGTHLIDASAGTGKTYTISAVYLRLLLERELAVKQILVVTYTEAATHDLRRRIREKIIDAFNAFSTGKAEEEILQKLLARFSDHHGRAVKLLGDALRSFDEASVYTIHGFCQRMLKENSLENGILFNSELVTDQDEYIVEVAEDFFRHHFYLASREFVEKAGPLLQPAATAPFLKKWLPHVGMRLLTAEDVPDDKTVADLEGRLRDVYYRAAQLWHGDGECIRELLLGCKGLNRNKYRLTSLPGWFVSMDKLFAGKEATVALFDRFNRFTTVELNNCVKKGGQAPEHHFFDSCQELAEAAADLAEVYRKKITILKARLLSDGNREIQARKEAHNVLAFDDLLRKLHGGLQGRQGKQLAESIRLRFPAAMIDEFQDTDPIQYEIFTSIYLGGRGMLYLIGDPKQAIYSFRGADIFAYIRAIRNIESRRTLMYNWRSEPGLIEAVNTLFGNRKNPFIFKEITFAPVLAAEKEQTRFSARGESDKPFHIVMLDREKEDNAALKQMAKQTAGERILESMADEIVKLLNLGADNRAHIADRTLQPGDLAVLVRTNDQARRVWRTLRKRRVPCVLQSTENLFGSHEAGELAIVLQALADPSDPRLVKGALVTDMFGLSAYDLVRVEEETELDRWLEKFREYSIMWHEKGFFRMMRRLTEKEGIRSRLLGYSDGERRAVNYLHLLEILHKTEQEKHLGPAGMIIFLRQRVYAAREESVEEYELRLESDADRVQIVTIHKSKGLQYPVVFCPFLWEGVGMTANRGEKTCAFHARDETLALTLDLGSDHLDENREKSLQEELAENLRIAYVALTRAAQRCYVYWGAFKTAGASGFARLVHGHRDDEQKGGQKPGLESFAHLSDPEIMEDLERLAQAAGNEIIVNAPGLPNYSEFMIDRGAGKELSCRQFSGVIDSAWRVSSFSALTASIEKQNGEGGGGERDGR